VRAYNGVEPQRGSGAESLVRGSGAQPPEAESFLMIGHPKGGANWPHVRVLNERNCNFGEMGRMGRGRGPRVPGQGPGGKATLIEAESFLRIRHPKEGTNWPHVRVLNERNVILGKGALWGEKGTILGAPEATNVRLLKGIKLIPPSTLAWHIG